ncbi:copper homeostasis protein CutC [Polycladidibacter hongkongensis]|uniref:copper homeostasis protein CutC n=1 Tax=Polycladidibacter hongkongensis TaxID=1647556 RepID=UPI00082EF99D|nr:copper homeostasis protein CutC [Pseudovibrio hongkongensis]
MTAEMTVSQHRICLEVCVDSHHGIEEAVKGGADRLELCSALAVGGLSPSVALIDHAKQSAQDRGIPVVSMLRPRPGGFCYTSAEKAGMLQEVQRIATAGLDGIVVGALIETPSPSSNNHLKNTAPNTYWLDEAFLHDIVLECKRNSLSITLHRAIDLINDPVKAAVRAAEIGFDRILSSGGELDAASGLDMLTAMHNAVRGRLSIMPGSGISIDNLRRFLNAFELVDIHASCSTTSASDEALVNMGFAEATMKQTCAHKVSQLKHTLQNQTTL